jgi:hypothetical protein
MTSTTTSAPTSTSTPSSDTYSLTSLQLQQILKSLKTLESMIMFERIAGANSSGGSGSITHEALERGFSRKVFYSRTHELKQAGLIFRANGRYTLSSLGKIVYSSLQLMIKAISQRWILDSIDVLERASDLNVRQKMLDFTITDQTIKNMLSTQRAVVVD